jgi:hypothetical protein
VQERFGHQNAGLRHRLGHLETIPDQSTGKDHGEKQTKQEIGHFEMLFALNIEGMTTLSILSERDSETFGMRLCTPNEHALGITHPRAATMQECPMA